MEAQKEPDLTKAREGQEAQKETWTLCHSSDEDEKSSRSSTVYGTWPASSFTDSGSSSSGYSSSGEVIPPNKSAGKHSPPKQPSGPPFSPQGQPGEPSRGASGSEGVGPNRGSGGPWTAAEETPADSEWVEAQGIQLLCCVYARQGANLEETATYLRNLGARITIVMAATVKDAKKRKKPSKTCRS